MQVRFGDLQAIDEDAEICAPKVDSDVSSDHHRLTSSIHAIALLSLSLVFLPAAAPPSNGTDVPGFDAECHKCNPAHVTAPGGWGLGNCVSRCKVQSCSFPVRCGSVVAGTCLVIESVNHDCTHNGVPNFVGVSQCNRCVVAMDVTCDEGETICMVNVQLTEVIVPDCKTILREQPCEEGLQDPVK